MNSDLVAKIGGVIELLLESGSRVNQAKPQQYWFPLSMATYGAEEILEALDSLCTFRTTMWEKTAAFETAFAEAQGRRHAVMVNSGSSADLLIAFALTNRAVQVLRPGDEILIPAVTWPTHVWSAMMAGLRIKLIDVNPQTLNLDPDALERAITPATRALFLVHLLGNPCDMDRIAAIAARHGLILLEDCCEALGAEWRGTRVGNFGSAASFSFFFSHHITTMEGGMIVVDDDQLAYALRVLRGHGWLRNVSPPNIPNSASDCDPRYAFVNWGFNLRPTELQAGFGLHQLRKLPEFNRRRQELARRMFAYLESTPFLRTPSVSDFAKPSWMALPIMLAPDAPFTRSMLTRYLEEHGIETRPIVAGNIARQPAGALFPELEAALLPGADAVHGRGFYIGLSPMMTDAAVDRVIGTFNAFVSEFVRAAV